MSDLATFYGGSILAMAGKDSVAIVNDKRLGMGAITASKDFTRIHQIGPKLYLGLPAFIPDSQILIRKVRKNYNLFKLEEQRDMEPEELTNMVSFILYSKRASPYYTTPIVVGLSNENKPYISSMDCLGCITTPGDFVAAGTAQQNLIGICEALYRPDMNEDNLFVTCVQAFLNSIDRDALSGWGADCFVIAKDRVIKRSIKGRCD